jgi:hypothetical protein
MKYLQNTEETLTQHAELCAKRYIKRLTLRIRTLYTLNGTGSAVGIGNCIRTKRTGVQILVETKHLFLFQT